MARVRHGLPVTALTKDTSRADDKVRVRGQDAAAERAGNGQACRMRLGRSDAVAAERGRLGHVVEQG